MEATSAAHVIDNVADSGAIVDAAAEAMAADGGEIIDDGGEAFQEMAKAYDLPKDWSYKLGDDIKFPDAVKNLVRNWNGQGMAFPVKVDCQVNWEEAQKLLLSLVRNLWVGSAKKIARLTSGIELGSSVIGRPQPKLRSTELVGGCNCRTCLMRTSPN